MWDPSDQCAKMGTVAQYSRATYLLVTELLDIVTDLICLILPFCILRNLHISLRKKIALGVGAPKYSRLIGRSSLPLPCLASFAAVSVSLLASEEVRNSRLRPGLSSKRQLLFALLAPLPFAPSSSEHRTSDAKPPTPTLSKWRVSTVGPTVEN